MQTPRRGSETARLGFLLVSSALILSIAACDHSTTGPDDNPPPAAATSFLMGYRGGGDQGASPGMVLVAVDGSSISRVSDYYPYGTNTAYVDKNGGRIAFAAQNPPDGSSPIAYVDADDPTNVHFVPIPPSNDADYFWAVPTERPQVMDDGRIAMRAIYNTDNPYDDYHDGMLVFFDPATGDFETTHSLSGFILDQPEQGYDTEGGSMGTSFALSPDNRFFVLTAYGYGTDAGVYHRDNFFLLTYDMSAKSYNRIALGQYTVQFVTNDNSRVVVDSDAKYVFTIATGAKMTLDDDTGEILAGMHASKSERFVKVWRGSGMGMYDVNTGWLYNAIDGTTLTGSFKGLGSGAQYSTDESKVYFTASADYYTNEYSTFEVMSTPADLGATDNEPDSLFVLGPEYDTKLFLVIGQ